MASVLRTGINVIILEIFSPKHLAFLIVNGANFAEEVRECFLSQFIDEKWQKSPKLVIITLTPGLCSFIYPGGHQLPASDRRAERRPGQADPRGLQPFQQHRHQRSMGRHQCYKSFDSRLISYRVGTYKVPFLGNSYSFFVFGGNK
jgi:hypothetical protein